nr:ImmA/IrrE family metallo-endopeptidase [Saccharopolyspora antimicrobica]
MIRKELDQLGIVGPADMAEVCRRFGARRGKPLKLVAYPLEVPGPFGLWIATPAADFIIYQKETTNAHQQHIIAHELGHIISGHTADDADEDGLGGSFPDIPPDHVRRALRRTHYDTVQEREAETAATLLLERAAVLEQISLPSRTPRARRAQQAFGEQQDWL